MRVLYDYQIFQDQRYGGISRYFCEIISRLPKEITPILSTLYSENHYLQALQPSVSNKNLITEEKFFSSFNFKGKWRLYALLKNYFPLVCNEYTKVNKDYSIQLLQKQNFDIFHPTYYNPYFLEYIGKKPFVLTVHDMIHEKFPHFFSSKDKTAEWKQLLLPKAHSIIAVSETTKQDILDLYAIPESKISVIYHGSSLEKSNAIIDLPLQYVLFVGSREGYKNFNFFIQAVAPILKERNISLVCVGSPFNNQEQLLLRELEIEPVCRSIQAKDDEMFTIYSNALCFVFPSLYEGFGIPILEAFEAECPVLLSDIAVFREIAGDAAVYFNPNNSLDIRHTLDSILFDTQKKTSTKNIGNNILKEFNWNKSTKLTLDIYNKTDVKK